MILLIGRMSSAAAVVVVVDDVVVVAAAWYAAFACGVDWIAAVEIARPAAAVMMRRASGLRLGGWCVVGVVLGGSWVGLLGVSCFLGRGFGVIGPVGAGWQKRGCRGLLV